MLKRSVSLTIHSKVWLGDDKNCLLFFEDQKIWIYLLISSLSRNGYKRLCGPCFLYLSFHAIHLWPTFEIVSYIFTEKSAFNKQVGYCKRLFPSTFEISWVPGNS